MIARLSNSARRAPLLKFVPPFLALVILTGWLVFTPDGLLGKADAVGYAVCHRIEVRSFMIGERSFPVCSRCSGMYLGALLGLAFQLKERRLGGMPAKKFMVILGGFAIGFVIDGVNSYLHFFPAAPVLYEPQNWLRLLTGTFLGLGIAAMLLPVTRQTLWADWRAEPALRSWRQAAALLALAGLLMAALLSNNPLLLYPLALLSSGTILLILTMIYTLIWVMLTRKENHFRNGAELWPYWSAGLATALLQIALMDAARYALTGTWQGLGLPLGT